MAVSRRCLSTWWAPLPSKQAVRAIPVRRVRFPSTSAFSQQKMASSKTLRKLLALMLATSLAFASTAVLSTGSLGAQARLLESSPSDGEALLTLDNIRLEFDSLLIADASATVTVTRTNGQSIPVVDLSVEDTVLSARVTQEIPSGTYDIDYAVRSADGGINEGTLRVSVDEPSQALSGGLLAVLGIFFALFGVMLLVFFADKRRRPERASRRSAT